MARLDDFLKTSPSEFTGMKLGLERIREFLAKLGNPQDAYPAVLVAGTNGKGSVVRIMESVLVAAGHEVGAYTSPHLERFTERIRIGGVEVEPAELEAVLADFEAQGLMPAPGELGIDRFHLLTWFEKVTALAFEVFRRRKIAIALLEVGLGGRLDATNVVSPIASAIVSIGHDHQKILGRSLFEIAKEKAGVMRAGKPVILGSVLPEVEEFLLQAAYLHGAIPRKARHLEGDPEGFAYGPYAGMKLGLAGRHQMRNAEVALELLEEVAKAGFAIDEAQLRIGLETVRNPGRLERIPGTPEILLDGAHNQEGLASLVAYLREHDLQRPITLVLGMMADKEILPALKILAPLKPRFILTAVDSPRSMQAQQWRDMFQSLKWEGEFFERSDAAMRYAREITDKDGVIVVAGSLYLVGEVRSLVAGN